MNPYDILYDFITENVNTKTDVEDFYQKVLELAEGNKLTLNDIQKQYIKQYILDEKGIKIFKDTLDAFDL